MSAQMGPPEYVRCPRRREGSSQLRPVTMASSGMSADAARCLPGLRSILMSVASPLNGLAYYEPLGRKFWRITMAERQSPTRTEY